MARPDATEPPWRAEADTPACFGPDGRSLGTVIRDARGRRVLRLCPPGTGGIAAIQAAAAAAAMVTLANGAAATIEAVPRRPRARRDGSSAGVQPVAAGRGS